MSMRTDINRRFRILLFVNLHANYLLLLEASIYAIPDKAFSLVDETDFT